MRQFSLFLALLGLLTGLASASLLGGCSSNTPKGERRVLSNPLDKDEKRTDRRLAKLTVEELYASAKESLESGDPQAALKLYDDLQGRFPFTRYATQAQLESVYAQYRAQQPELAIAAANRFIKQHPQHPEIDYVYYIKGLVNFDRGQDEFDKLMKIDGNRRDPVYARTAFEDFSLLITRFPDSKFAQDARKRMIYLREGLGYNEFHVASFYFKRRAYVAASRRAQYIIEHYQGTRAVAPALDILEQSYQKLGLEQQATETHATLATNYPDYLKKRGNNGSEAGWERWFNWVRDPFIKVFD